MAGRGDGVDEGELVEPIRELRKLLPLDESPPPLQFPLLFFGWEITCTYPPNNIYVSWHHQLHTVFG